MVMDNAKHILNLYCRHVSAQKGCFQQKIYAYKIFLTELYVAVTMTIARIKVKKVDNH
uniref:RNA pseudourine synthase 6 n=1 Tax=Rhizophora mucronata TaxID=61149 RepID=A0A2P2KV32_RHIMU